MDRLLEILVKHDVMTAAQVAEVQKIQQEQTDNADLAHVLYENGYATEKEIAKAQGEIFGAPFVDFGLIEVSKEALALVPPDLAKRYKVVPIEVTATSITMGMANPQDFQTIESLQLVLRKEIRCRIASQSDIQEALAKYYKIQDKDPSIDSVIEEFEGGAADDAPPMEAVMAEIEVDEGDETPVIKLVSLIVLEAFRSRASDIHLEPFGKNFRVRYRIDGVLHEVPGPPKRLQGAVISRMKIMAKLDIAEKRIPQDGRIKLTLLEKEVDFRVSSIPSVYGESIVLRILDKSSLLLGLSEIGLLPDDEKKFEKLLMTPNGVILVTGPTGSGKTTTLYTALNYINRPDRKLITIEDPVEYQLRGINQVQVSPKVGLTFAGALRACLRQAPDVIMVGEIRDFETGAIAIQSALTGHLVFSTLHTNDAPRAVTRLIDMGIKPYLVASSVQAIIAQRLVRTICKKCRKQYDPTEIELKAIGLTRDNIMNSKIYKGDGCRDCGNAGYKGRLAIFEILHVTDTIRDMIYRSESTTAISAVARQEGMHTLREDGIRKFLRGLTTVEEIIRVTDQDSG